MEKSYNTKQRILKATIELVANKGYASTSTREIANNAGISEATIFKYYKNKDQLLKEIVQTTIEKFYNYSINEVVSKIDNRSDLTRETIENILSERLLFFERNNKTVQIVFQEMMINETVRELFRQKIWTEMNELSNTLFDRGKKIGAIRNIDNFYLRKALFGMMFYTIIIETMFGGDKNHNSKEQAKIITDILFNGIKN